MSEYWDGLLKHRETKKMVEYDTPMHGQQNIAEVREQIQEDILSCLEMHNCSFRVQLADDLCQLVVDNFKKLEK